VKAVIPAAGLGIRFLPYTKAQPKEMLPVLDKPAIQYVVEEAVAAGLEDILIVTGRGKRAIEDHFDRNIDLETHLRRTGHLAALEEIQALWKAARVHYIRQGEPLGLGHAIGVAESYVSGETFACLLGDDMTVDRVPCIRQLMEVSEQEGGSVIAVQRVPRDRMQRYGMIVAEPVGGGLHRIKDVIEKPKPSEVTSELAAIGRYVLTPTIFEELRDLKPSVGGEIQLADGLRQLAEREEVLAYEYRGRRYDLGSKVDWIMANLEFALGRDELASELWPALEQFLQRTRRKAGIPIDEALVKVAR